jgi:hypothetical protein
VTESLRRRRTIAAVPAVVGAVAAISVALAIVAYTWGTPVPRPPALLKDGFVAPSDWPDACALGDGADPALTHPRPQTGTLPDGTALPAAKSCAWSLADGTRVSLDVKVVLRDVDNAFGGYQFGVRRYRVVDGLGDEAFLDSPTLREQPEVLYVCKGHTIFTVAVEGLGREAAREVLLGVGERAVDTLAALPAGRRPPR